MGLTDSEIVRGGFGGALGAAAPTPINPSVRINDNHIHICIASVLKTSKKLSPIHDSWQYIRPFQRKRLKFGPDRTKRTNV